MKRAPQSVLSPAARAARAREVALKRAADAPRVRALHEQGLCVNAIVRRSGHAANYVKVLLAEMGLTPHGSPHGPRRGSVKARAAAHAGVLDSQRVFVKAGAQACVDHFRDLVAAYPGRKLRSLDIPEGYARRFPRPETAPTYSSSAAMCAEFGAGAWR